MSKGRKIRITQEKLDEKLSKFANHLETLNLSNDDFNKNIDTFLNDYEIVKHIYKDESIFEQQALIPQQTQEQPQQVVQQEKPLYDLEGNMPSDAKQIEVIDFKQPLPTYKDLKLREVKDQYEKGDITADQYGQVVQGIEYDNTPISDEEKLSQLNYVVNKTRKLEATVDDFNKDLDVSNPSVAYNLKNYVYSETEKKTENALKLGDKETAKTYYDEMKRHDNILNKISYGEEKTDAIFGDVEKYGIDKRVINSYLNSKDTYVDAISKMQIETKENDSDRQVGIESVKFRSLTNAIVNEIRDLRKKQSIAESLGEQQDVNDYQKQINDLTQGIYKYKDTELQALTQAEKQAQERQAEQYKDLKESPYISTAKDLIIGMPSEIGIGILHGIEDPVATVFDLIGADSVAERIRLHKEGDAIANQDLGTYVVASVKRKRINGTEYGLTEDGRLLDLDTAKDVTGIADKAGIDYEAIAKELKETGKEDTTYSATGLALEGSNMLGALLPMILTTKGVGTLAKGGETAMKLTSAGVQGAIMYSTTYENTLKTLRDAGISEEKARAGATQVATTVGLIATATGGSISPKLGLVDSFENSTLKRAILDGVDKANGTFTFPKTFRVIKEVAGQDAQMILQNLGQSQSEKSVNAQLGQDVLRGKITADDVKTTMLLTPLAILGTHLAGKGSRSVRNKADKFLFNKVNPSEKVQIYTLLSEEIGQTKTILSELVKTKKVSEKHAQELLKQLKDFKENKERMPKDVPVENAIEMTGELAKKKALEEEKSRVDNVFHDEINEQIDEVVDNIKQLRNNQLTEKAFKQADEKGEIIEAPIPKTKKSKERLLSKGFVEQDGKMVRKPKDAFSGIDKVLAGEDVPTEEVKTKNVVETKELVEQPTETKKVVETKDKVVEPQEKQTKEVVETETNKTKNIVEKQTPTKETKQKEVVEVFSPEFEYETKQDTYKVKAEDGKLKVVSKYSGKEPSKQVQKKAETHYIETAEFDRGKRADLSELGQSITDEQVSQEVATQSENPLEVAQEIKRQREINKDNQENKDMSKDGAIAKALDKTKVSKESFIQADDRNNLPDVNKHYFSKANKNNLGRNGKGANLDELREHAQQFTNEEVTLQDIAEFMKRNRTPKEYLTDTKTTTDLDLKFEKLTGLKATDETINKIVERYKPKTETVEEIDDIPFQTKSKFGRIIGKALKDLLGRLHKTNLSQGFKVLDGNKGTTDFLQKIVGKDVKLQQETELQQIKEKAITDGTFMKAPNGQKTNLNEKQWLQVRSKNFKEWFGDWENNPEQASKVVDENGEPLVVYHGSKDDFNVFDKNKQGLNHYQSKSDVYGGGFFFTDKKNKAFEGVKKAFFIKTTNANTTELSDNFGTKVDYYNATDMFDNNYETFFENSKTHQKDGIIIKTPRGSLFVVFESNQIKSATENTGEFSLDNPDIRFQKELADKGVILTPNGFVYDGVVYINSDRVKADTPIHEYGHLWLEYVKDTNKEVHKKGQELIEGTEYHKAVEENEAYKNLSKEEKLDEALAQAIGEKGAKIMEQSKKEKFAQWFKNLFKQIATGLRLRNMTPDELANMTIEKYVELASGELLMGEKIVKDKNSRFKPEYNKNGIDIALAEQKAILETSANLDAKFAEKKRFAKNIKAELVDYISKVIKAKHNGYVNKNELRKINKAIEKAETKAQLEKAKAKVDDLVLDIEERKAEHKKYMNTLRAEQKNKLREEIRKTKQEQKEKYNEKLAKQKDKLEAKQDKITDLKQKVRDYIKQNLLYKYNSFITNRDVIRLIDTVERAKTEKAVERALDKIDALIEKKNYENKEYRNRKELLSWYINKQLNSSRFSKQSKAEFREILDIVSNTKNLSDKKLGYLIDRVDAVINVIDNVKFADKSIIVINSSTHKKQNGKAIGRTVGFEYAKVFDMAKKILNDYQKERTTNENKNIKETVLDEQGNPVLDENGKPIKEKTTYDSEKNKIEVKDDTDYKLAFYDEKMERLDKLMAKKEFGSEGEEGEVRTQAEENELDALKIVKPILQVYSHKRFAKEIKKLKKQRANSENKAFYDDLIERYEIEKNAIINENAGAIEKAYYDLLEYQKSGKLELAEKKAELKEKLETATAKAIEDIKEHFKLNDKQKKEFDDYEKLPEHLKKQQFKNLSKKVQKVVKYKSYEVLSPEQLAKVNSGIGAVVKKAIFSVVYGRRMAQNLMSLGALVSRSEGTTRDDSALVQVLNGAVQSHITKEALNQNFNERLNQAVRDIYGNQRKAYQSLGKRVKVNIKGVDVPHTVNELLYAWMLSKDVRLHKGLEKAGFTTEVLSKIDKILTPKEKQLADVIYDVYDKLYELNNEVYKKFNFVDLPKEEFYAGRVMRTGFELEERNISQLNSMRGSVAHRSLKERTGSDKEISLVNATDLLRMAIAETSHYVAFQETYKQFNNLFGNKDFKRNLEIYNKGLGKEIFDIFDYYRKNHIEQTPKDKYAKILNYFGKRVIVPVLALKKKLTGTQTVSIINGIYDMPPMTPKKLAKYTFDVKGNYKALQEAKQRDYWKKRYKFGDITDIEVAMSKGADKFHLQNATAESYRMQLSAYYDYMLNKAMLNVKYGDMLGVMGHIPQINAWTDYYKDKGYKYEVAREKAFKRFEASVDRSQQSITPFNKSIWQNNPYLKYLLTFQSSPIQNLNNALYHERELVRALRGYDHKGSMLRNATGVLNYRFAQPMLYAYVTYIMAGSLFPFLEDDDEAPNEADKALLSAGLLGNQQALPVIGNLASFLVKDALLNQKSTFSENINLPLIESYERLGKAVIDYAHARTKQTAGKHLRKAIVQALGLIGKVPNQLSGSVIDLMDEDGIYRTDKVEADVKMLKALGYSEWKIKQLKNGRMTKEEAKEKQEKADNKYDDSPEYEKKIPDVFLKQ